MLLGTSTSNQPTISSAVVITVWVLVILLIISMAAGAFVLNHIIKLKKQKIQELEKLESNNESSNDERKVIELNK